MGLWLRSFGHLVGALRMTIRRSFLQRAEEERSFSLASQAEAWPLQIFAKDTRRPQFQKQRLPATVRGHERPQVQKADPSYVRASLN